MKKLSRLMLKEAMSTHFRMMIRAYLSGRKKIKGAELYWCNEIDDHFNNFSMIHSMNGFNRTIGYITTFYKNIKRKPTVFLTPFSRPRNIENALKKHGFALKSREAWMFYKKTAQKLTLPDKFEIREVLTNEDMKIFVNVFHKAYGGADQNEPYGNLPKGYSKCVEKAFMKNRRNPINYIGFLNDKPVGIGSMIRSGRFAGIYNIGVIPCARKNGIGSLMTLNAVNNAIKHKANIIFLQTVADSYNEKLYKRIGFKTEFVGESFVLGD